MNPEQFVKFVADAATVTNLPRDRLLIGGDHLGPNRWREQPAAAASFSVTLKINEDPYAEIEQLAQRPIANGSLVGPGKMPRDDPAWVDPPDTFHG